MMLIALACLIAAGAAVASILGRDNIPFTQFSEATPAGPVANTEAKTDKLAVTAAPASAPFKQDRAALPLGEPLRQAFASDSPLDPVQPDFTAPVAIPPSVAPQKLKLAAKPPIQKNYSLLSDAQIAGIKNRLKLTAAQETYWPNIETALRAVAKKIHDKRQANPAAGSPPIDPESAEVAQLKSAAMPLLLQLREDQKREVRSLARIIGLEAVASRI